eukprot:TRINITY_DN1943_c0_g1_i1.p1 TRINITY_DN1943_c0_g1~~TRINITY_DN1943_c0_g1_i1.p1  ORF type:complete len:570 (+),score=275.91 TRINITY_DN1943_c0_g1_i1:147-1712(+)
MAGTYTSPFFGFQFEYDTEELKIEEDKTLGQQPGVPAEAIPLLMVNFVPKRASPQHYIGGLGQLSVENKPKHSSLEQIEQMIIATASEGVDPNSLEKREINLGTCPGSLITFVINASVFGPCECYNYLAVRGDHIYRLTFNIIKQQDPSYLKVLHRLIKDTVASWKWLKNEPLKIRAVEFHHFVSAEHGFRFRYPLDWTVKDASKRAAPKINGPKASVDSSLRVVDFEWSEEETKIEVIVSIETVPESISIDQYVDLAKLAMERGMIYLGNVTTKEVLVADSLSVALYYEDLSNNKYLRVYVRKGTKIIVLSFYSNAKEMEEMPMFVRMINTFEFLSAEEAASEPSSIFEDFETYHGITFPQKFKRILGGEKGGFFICNPAFDATFEQNKLCSLHISHTPLFNQNIDMETVTNMFDETYFQQGQEISNISSSKATVNGVQWVERLQTGKFINVDGTKMVTNPFVTKRFSRLGFRNLDDVQLLYLVVIEAPVSQFDEVFASFESVMKSFGFFDPESLWSPNA